MARYYAQQDFNGIPVKGLVPETSATPPANPGSFQLWGDSSTGELKWYKPGAGWTPVDEIPDGSVTADKVPDGALPVTKLTVNPLSRSSHTGTQPASTISDLETTVKAYRLHEFRPPAAPLDMGGQRVTNASAPTGDTDLVTKAYLDAAIAQARHGIAGVKDPVRVAVTTNIDLAAPGETLDGVTMNPGDRFLAVAQTNPLENGIYVYNGPTTPATRAPDADNEGEILDGTVVAVAEGTKHGARYMQQATPSGPPGSWAQTWVEEQVSGSTYTADPNGGLQLVGNAFSIKLATNSGLATGPDGLTVGLVTVARGGTGATTAAEARTNLGATGKFTANLPALTAGTWTTITHNLGTDDVVATIKEIATGEAVKIRWRTDSVNTVQVRADVDVPANSLRIVVVG
ncbi:hypothetical protein [Thermobispora bispora]|uniref:hypothetical protein n=1 Tax=Thermobispora bispora TaxID=2006 RepID=UPI00198085DF|nr:hypothetical protein [Thermobispora bispora]QSI49997.1 hypothetical protein CYL17_18665 [Thermobispora bispora]